MSTPRTSLLVIAVLALAGCAPASQDFNGTFLDPPVDHVPFELTSAAGPVASSDFQGKWLAMFFGYTQCPDICPATMTTLKRAIDGLDEDQQEEVRVAMISVDPERDSPERLASYTSAFNPSFVGMTGSEAQLEQIANEYGIYYERQAAADDGSYEVDHTAAVLLLDPQGRMRMVWSYGTSPEEITSDLQKLIG